METALKNLRAQMQFEGDEVAAVAGPHALPAVSFGELAEFRTLKTVHSMALVEDTGAEKPTPKKFARNRPKKQGAATPAPTDEAANGPGPTGTDPMDLDPKEQGTSSVIENDGDGGRSRPE